LHLAILTSKILHPLCEFYCEYSSDFLTEAFRALPHITFVLGKAFTCSGAAGIIQHAAAAAKVDA
jgi:hypothetical protein